MVWSPLKILFDNLILHSRWWPLLKLEISLIVYCCFIISQNELKFQSQGFGVQRHFQQYGSSNFNCSSKYILFISKGVGPLSSVFGPYLKTYNLQFFFIKEPFFFMLCICFSPRVHLSQILGQKHENNTKNADFWKFFIEEKANAEQIIQLSHTM